MDTVTAIGLMGVAVLTVPYVWLLSKVVCNAYFSTKQLYQRDLIEQLRSKTGEAR